MARDQYDYSDTVDVNELTSLVNKLKAHPKGKDALLKLLTQLGNMLEKAPQDVSCLGPGARHLGEHLSHASILHSTDKEVKIYAAYCLSSLLRIYAPETPFSDETMKDIFKLITSCLPLYADGKSVNFSLCRSILQTMCQVRTYLVLLDLDTPDLVLNLWKALLNIVNDENMVDFEVTINKILVDMVEEMDIVPVSIVDALLTALGPGGGSAKNRLAGLVLQTAETKLRGPVQKRLSELISQSGPGVSGLVKGSLAHVLAHAHQACPTLLAPLLPLLVGELGGPDMHKRSIAIEVVTGLVCGVGWQLLTAEIPALCDELMRRYHDKEADLRIQMLQHTRETAESCPSHAMFTRALAACTERLLDFDENVRVAAVEALCGLEENKPGCTGALKAVSLRLRDKKPRVRQATLKGVVTVFRAAIRIGNIGLVNWVPSRLAWDALKDPLIFRSFMEELAATGSGRGAYGCGLFPTSISRGQATRIWLEIYSSAADASEREALLRLIGQKSRIQMDLRSALILRSQSVSSTASSEDKEAASRRLSRAVSELAVLLELDNRDKQQLESLLTNVKDGHVYKRLAVLANPATEPSDFAKDRKDAAQRVGSKSQLAPVLNALADGAAPSLLPVAVLEGMLSLVGGETDETKEEGLEVASPELIKDATEALIAVVKHAPSLLSGLFPQLAETIASGPEHARTVATRAVAYFVRAALRMGSRYPIMSDISSSQTTEATNPLTSTLVDFSKSLDPDLREEILTVLDSACTSPTSPLLAKSAPAVIWAILADAQERQEVIGKLVRKLERFVVPAKALPPGTHAAIQAFGSIARIEPDLVASLVPAFVQFITDHYLTLDSSALAPKTAARGKAAAPAQVDLSALALPGGLSGFPDATPEARLKVAALKAAVRSCVPEGTGAPTLAAIVGQLFIFLEGLLDPAEHQSVIGIDGDTDAAFVRMTAAESMLRLARVHDAQLTPATHVVLALTLQDPSPVVREMFAAQLRRYIASTFHARGRASLLSFRYAAAWCLSAMDPDEVNRSAARSALKEYIAVRRAAAHGRSLAAAGVGAGEQAAANGAAAAPITIQDSPVFIMLYVVFLLAHHPDFPELPSSVTGDAPDVEEIAGGSESLQPFVNMLQFVLEVLLAAGPGHAFGEGMPALLKLMRYLKVTSDMVEEGLTPAVHSLADMTVATAHAICERVKGAAGAAALEGQYPGTVVLPRSLFRFEEGFKTRKQTSQLPRGFHIVLQPVPPPAGGAHSGEKKEGQKRRPREEDSELKDAPLGPTPSPKRKKSANKPAANANRTPLGPVQPQAPNVGPYPLESHRKEQGVKGGQTPTTLDAGSGEPAARKSRVTRGAAAAPDRKQEDTDGSGDVGEEEGRVGVDEERVEKGKQAGSRGEAQGPVVSKGRGKGKGIEKRLDAEGGDDGEEEGRVVKEKAKRGRKAAGASKEGAGAKATSVKEVLGKRGQRGAGAKGRGAEKKRRRRDTPSSEEEESSEEEQEEEEEEEEREESARAQEESEEKVEREDREGGKRGQPAAGTSGPRRIVGKMEVALAESVPETKRARRGLEKETEPEVAAAAKGKAEAADKGRTKVSENVDKKQRQGVDKTVGSKGAQVAKKGSSPAAKVVELEKEKPQAGQVSSVAKENVPEARQAGVVGRAVRGAAREPEGAGERQSGDQAGEAGPSAAPAETKQSRLKLRGQTTPGRGEETANLESGRAREVGTSRGSGQEGTKGKADGKVKGDQAECVGDQGEAGESIKVANKQGKGKGRQGAQATAETVEKVPVAAAKSEAARKVPAVAAKGAAAEKVPVAAAKAEAAGKAPVAAAGKQLRAQGKAGGQPAFEPTAQVALQLRPDKVEAEKGVPSKVTRQVGKTTAPAASSRSVKEQPVPTSEQGVHSKPANAAILKSKKEEAAKGTRALPVRAEKMAAAGKFLSAAKRDAIASESTEVGPSSNEEWSPRSPRRSGRLGDQGNAQQQGKDLDSNAKVSKHVTTAPLGTLHADGSGASRFKQEAKATAKGRKER